jgi:hypothetical protein
MRVCPLCRAPQTDELRPEPDLISDIRYGTDIYLDASREAREDGRAAYGWRGVRHIGATLAIYAWRRSQPSSDVIERTSRFLLKVSAVIGVVAIAHGVHRALSYLYGNECDAFADNTAAIPYIAFEGPLSDGPAASRLLEYERPICHLWERPAE